MNECITEQNQEKNAEKIPNLNLDYFLKSPLDRKLDMLKELLETETMNPKTFSEKS